MAEMVRKQVYIEPRQDALLKRLSRDLGLSEAELIRSGIDRFLGLGMLPARDLTVWAEERHFIQQRMNQAAIRGERTWKREALYDA